MLTAQSLFDVNQYAKLTNLHKDIWVAYSGGVDSHVLLHSAKQCFANIRAIHINHALNASDDLMQEHCERVCKQLMIPLHCMTVDANPKSGQSKETAARDARRVAWQNVLRSEDVLLLAHHAADQAETILYRLIRGTGPHGLAGMRQCSKLGVVTIMRPLLTTQKQEIVAYAQAHNLSWFEDSSNQDISFDRNYIRNNIMPLLQQRWPATIKNINRAGKVCNQVLQFVEPLVANKLAAIVDAKNALNLQILTTETILWQQELVRAWLQQHGITPSLKQLTIILQEIINARSDAMPQLVIGTKIIKRSKNKLHVLHNDIQDQTVYVVSWNLQQELLLPTGQLITVEQLSFQNEFIEKLAHYQVTVRQGVLGRKAKKIFQQHAIPPWERTSYPLIYADDRLVGILGLWCTSRL